MNQHHVIHQRARVWRVVLALLCAFAFSAPTLNASAKSANGTVTVHGTIVAKIVIPPIVTTTVQLKLIDKTLLRVTANKKEWYYVYTFVDGNVVPGTPPHVVPVTVQSNRAWTGKLTAVQTAGDKKKMDLAGGLLHLSLTRPTTYAQADAAMAVKTASINLSSILPSSTFNPGSRTFYQYFLVHVSEGSGSTAFAATLTYSVSQVPSSGPAATSGATLTFNPADCCS
jgi:hypothetical protein